MNNMNEQSDQHVPSPEFRASLEREVVQAFRRQSQFTAPPGIMKRGRLRTAATLVIGLVIGVGGAAATAQVQGAKVRDSLMITNEMNRKFAQMRLELAKAELDLVTKSVNAGARPESDLDPARINVMSAEFAIKKLDLAAEEMQATGLPPNDELWAPLIGKRDFVLQRLYYDLVIGGQQQYRAQAVLADAVRRAQLGVIRPSDTTEVSGALQRVTAELQMAYKKQELRKQFLENTLSQAQIAEKLQLYNLQLQMSTMMIKFREAAERAKRSKELLGAGVSTVVDVKRAELDSLESAQAIARLQALLKLSETAQAMQKAADALKKKP